MPDQTTAEEVIVLAGFAGRSQGELGSARPEVADLAANAKAPPDSDIQTQSPLDYP